MPKTPPRRPVSTQRVGMLLAFDAVRDWIVPASAGTLVLLAAAGSATGLLSSEYGVLGAVIGALAFLLHLGLRPLLASDTPGRPRIAGGALAVVWSVLCLGPFASRLFPGNPLLASGEIGSASTHLPLAIPGSGGHAVDVVIEGKLGHAATGAVLPVNYTLTFDDAEHHPQTISGRFDETLKTQRLGRRGSTVVHQEHVAERHELDNPAGGELVLTGVTLEPADSPPVIVTVFPHPLPSLPVIVITAAALLAAVIAFERLPALEGNDGTFTLSTAAVIGAAAVFWTTNTVQPTIQTLVGSALFGGPIGFGVGALVWWLTKQLVGRPVAR